jgi:hypothetical protein
VTEARIWTATEIRALGVRTDVETGGSIFGLSRTQAYVAVDEGRFPVPTFRIGRRIVVPVAPIIRLLGLETEAAGVGSPAADTDQLPKGQVHTDGNPRTLQALG